MVRGFRTTVADKLLDTFSVGDLIPHKWIQNEVGLTFRNIDSMENHTLFNKEYGCHQAAIIHLVRERGSRLLVSVKTRGYQLVHPIDHFSTSAVKSIKVFLREYIRLEKSLACIDYLLLESDGIGHDHPQLVSDREARRWIENWIASLFYSEGRPEGIINLVEAALKELNKEELRNLDAVMNAARFSEYTRFEYMRLRNNFL